MPIFSFESLFNHLTARVLGRFSEQAYKTSGANETMRMKRSDLSSRVTGPKIRVPMGCLFAFSNTAAF
jgi:hypothetical protein